MLLAALLMGRGPARDVRVLVAKSKMGGGCKASLLKSWSHKASGEGAKYTSRSRHLKSYNAKFSQILITFRRYTGT